MTINYATGEIIEFDTAAAERRAERIINRLDAIAENYSRVLPMIREAIEKRDDLALGYRSPGDYVSDRFGQSLAGLGLEVRRAVVGELTEAGLSTRAIAPVVGASRMAVQRDRDAISGVTAVTPDLTTSTPEDRGTTERETDDGVVVAQPEGASFSSQPDIPATNEGAPEVSPARPPVTGIDGKTYSRPAPKSVMNADQANYDNATQASTALSRAVRKLLEFQHPNMREGMRKYWSMASIEVPPAQRADVTPEQMRVAAHGLLALADEWEVQ